ncbi:MAG: anhydro-N-acetylmuramic acid kinase [Boseongicola sp. SB0673_bin_14]|nr:anhydro-N-acetylmuramic acid kinase [Boseongicola sp. SB0673_bin_14]
MPEDGSIWVAGTMSGTSLDGVDAAMIRTDGTHVLEFGRTGYRPYSPTEREILRSALGHEQGREIDAAAKVVEAAHVEILSEFDGAELVGFHGQTTLHRPDEGRTRQIGDGESLAGALGVPVAWDFRSEDMRHGGQGAPLAPFYHFALARMLGVSGPVAFLNLGGVANLTWLDPLLPTPESPGACLAFDTGPGNAPINDLCQVRLNAPMDQEGRLTSAGNVNAGILGRLVEHHEYFSRPPPKSLDRNEFSGWLPEVHACAPADAAATLAAGAAQAVALGLAHCPQAPIQVLVSGGGRKNRGLMALLTAALDSPVMPVEEVGLDGDMLEAQAFGYLAARVRLKLPTSAPGTTGAANPVCGGTVSEP